MPNSESLQIHQRIGMRLSQQQLRFVRLLELNTRELEEAVYDELQENPALTISPDDEPSLHNDVASVGADKIYNSRELTPIKNSEINETWQDPPENPESLYDHLLSHLQEKKLSETTKIFAEYIIGNIDSNGWLTRPLDSLLTDFEISCAITPTSLETEDAFNAVRSLDPAGVGALSLQDCLVLQLKRLPKSEVQQDALTILTQHFDAFSLKHSHKIISALGMNQTRAEQAVKLILSLNPKPGSVFSHSNHNLTIIPDVILTFQNGEIYLKLNNSIPELRIDSSFEQALKEMKKMKIKRENAKSTSRQETEFISSRLKDAKDFIKILNQRQTTLLSVVSAIVEIQHKYFQTQDIYSLKPMMIKDISRLTGLDISVISRATNQKFLETPWGIFPLRFFFSDTIGEATGENALTNRKIEAEISRLINSEDKKHPLSDEKIKQLMNNNGLELSRRTVAKYRDRLGIPVARLRKKLNSQ